MTDQPGTADHALKRAADIAQEEFDDSRIPGGSVGFAEHLGARIVAELNNAGLLLTPEREAELRNLPAEADTASRRLSDAVLDEREHWLRRAATGPGGEHYYLSTGCLANTQQGHEHCQAPAGIIGAKIPAASKFSAAACVCSCHRLTSEDTHD